MIKATMFIKNIGINTVHMLGLRRLFVYYYWIIYFVKVYVNHLFLCCLFFNFSIITLLVIVLGATSCPSVAVLPEWLPKQGHLRMVSLYTISWHADAHHKSKIFHQLYKEKIWQKLYFFYLCLGSPLISCCCIFFLFFLSFILV